MTNPDDTAEIRRRQFSEEGFFLARQLFSPALIQAAREWLDAQKPDQLTKSWTETEPGVPVAVYSVAHEQDTPITALVTHPDVLRIGEELMGEPVYVWSSKVNMKAAWCGTAEYYHQDFAYWKDRGYLHDSMLSCMIFLDPHGPENAGLHVIPRTHTLGPIDHTPFININGLAKAMVPRDTLWDMAGKYGLRAVEAEPGDALFFHASLIHGSSHNVSPHRRAVALAQMNTVRNQPDEVSTNARDFNLRRAESEFREAERRYLWFKQKYEAQAASSTLTFGPPIPKPERH